MKLVYLTYFIFFCSLNSQAQSLVGRQFVANKIIKLKKVSCEKESKKLKDLLELAATLVIHGERMDMVANLKKAQKKSKSKTCTDGIQKLID